MESGADRQRLYPSSRECDSDKEHAKSIEVLLVLMGAQQLLMSSLPVDAPVRGGTPAFSFIAGEAARKYLLTLDPSLLSDKTRSQKKAVVDGFSGWKGLKAPLADVARTEVSEWVQSLNMYFFKYRLTY